MQRHDGRRPVDVFIDVPNIVRGAARPRISWSVLCKEIERRLKSGEYVRRAVAYLVTPQPDHSHYHAYTHAAEQLKSGLRIGGQELVIREDERDKDVDVYIVNDLWRSLVQFRDDMVRHVLVSGDSDYYMVYDDARAALGDLEFDLDVYTWRAKQSRTRGKFLLHTVVELDTIANLIDLSSVRLFAVK